MGAHIFLASEENFQTCVRHGVYGCVLPHREWNKAEVVAGLLSVQPNDLIFFYVKNRGIYGLWKAVGEPFYDETQIWSNAQQSYPFRITFESVVGSFPKPVSLIDVLDLHDKGRIWTFDLNPVQRKNQYKITMAEARELLRLLLRDNPVRRPPLPVPSPYAPSRRDGIRIEIGQDKKGRVKYEGWLNAWFMRAFSRGMLKDLFGDYREFLNLVPTAYNKVMDIFLTHVTDVEGLEILYKYTCMELKAGRAAERDLAQVLRYEDLLARRLAAGEKEMIQTVLVAQAFSTDVVDYVKDRRRIEERTVRLFRYNTTDDEVGIRLEEIQSR